MSQFHYSRRLFATVSSAILGFTVVLPATTLFSSSSTASENCISTSSWQSLTNQFNQWKAHKIGHYQNRIRSYSHPSKVFQYFATICKNGVYYMTPNDFIHSLLPYIDTGYTNGNEMNQHYRRIMTQSAVSFFKLADTNGDGLIDFNEYMFITTLLSIPSHKFEIAFRVLDNDKNGVLSRDEFIQLVDKLYDSTAFYSRMGIREHELITSRHCHGILNLLFGPNGNQTLHINEFMGFMKQLQFQVLKLEYYSLPVDIYTDTINIKHMIALLFGYAELPILYQSIKRIMTLPNYSDPIHFSEYMELHQVLSRINDVTNVLVQQRDIPKYSTVSSTCVPDNNSSLLITRNQLCQAIHQATGYEVKPAIIDALFHVLKRNNDDDLIDFFTFKHVVGHRQTMGLDAPRNIELGDWISDTITSLFQKWFF